MKDDRSLGNEFNRQFELRTGLTKRDKSKYWNTEESHSSAWELPAAAGGKRGARLVLIAAASAVAFLAMVPVVWKLAGSSGIGLAQSPPDIGTTVRIQLAEEVAHAFLTENDPQRRLPWARENEAVALRLQAYAEEARSDVPVAWEPHGHHMENGLAKTAFAVRFKAGGFRLLEVVETAKGLRVDWDGYARYCSENWEDLLSGKDGSAEFRRWYGKKWGKDLLSGKAGAAEVRVFVSPGDHYNVPFEAADQWTCFRLMSPDLPESEDVFAYAEAGSTRQRELKRIVLGAPDFRQHMTLRIEGHEGAGGERLFEITRVLAIGWVRGERDVESVWEER